MMEYSHTPVISVFLLDVGDRTYRCLGPQLIKCVSLLEADDCPVFFNSQDSFSTHKGSAIAALSDFKPFEIKVSQWVQVLVKSVAGFDPDAAKRIFVIADEFKKIDEFKISMAMEKNHRENENTTFYFMPVLENCDYLKELSNQGLCRYQFGNRDAIGEFISNAIRQAYRSNRITSASDMESLKEELEQMEQRDEDRQRGDI
jgi:hypothetical protein